MRNTEIILIDDDADDCEAMQLAMFQINVQRPLKTFNEVDSAFDYLKSITHQPFLIICDINMPGINGLEFKELINKHNNQRIAATPFIFLTTAADPTTLRFAQNLNIQGYYEKATSITALEQLFEKIITYWENAALQQQPVNQVA